jgi:hypothetical protein
MSTLRADAAAKPQDYVRELRVGGHDVIEDQWRGETDSVTKVLLNNQVSMNPSLMVQELVVLAGGETDVTVSKAVGTLLGVSGYVAATRIEGALGITSATADADQVANPGLIALAGTVVAGNLVVTYLAA